MGSLCMRLDISEVPLWSQGVGNRLNISLLMFSTYTEGSERMVTIYLLDDAGLSALTVKRGSFNLVRLLWIQFLLQRKEKGFIHDGRARQSDRC